MWDELKSALEDRFHVLAVDLPGFGENSTPVESISDMARYVFGEMDKTNMPSATVFGHSMGGYIALEMLSLNAERIDGLGLIHSHAAPDTLEIAENRRKQMDFLTSNDVRHFLKPFSKRLIAPSRREDPEILSRTWQLVGNTQTPGITGALTAMIGRKDHRALLSQVNTPVLWLVGLEDEFMPRDEVLEQAGQTRIAMLECVEGVGHMIPFEKPLDMLRIINRFLSWVYDQDNS